MTGLTQKQVAEGVGMAHPAYQRYEIATREPAFQFAVALADFYGIPLDFLAGRDIYAHWEWLLANKEAVAVAVSPVNAGISDLNYLRLVLPDIKDFVLVEKDGVIHAEFKVLVEDVVSPRKLIVDA
jgi:transcriptional regulator with XRE-family HTH domain